MVYRSDIDGLRAIAVSIVIFFHFGIPGFSGGFIGVDVFFVLSGYLIGSIIVRQLKEDKFSLTQFYFRRIRRLFPVFVVVILVTTIAAYLIMLPSDFKEFGQSVIASSVYLSNILFYLEAGYFDTASHLKPLLHTWSLSVEEQFYIIFPILAWCIYRLNKSWLLPIFLFLTILSLIAAQWYLPKDTSAVFYLYPFRAWEMFLGVCLASYTIPQIRSAKGNSLLALLGFAMILIPGLFYTKSTAFPGLSALIPCLGTCILLYTGRSTSFTDIVLTNPVSVFLGKISYSLYLWHWPIFVLYMYDKGDQPQALDIVLMTTLTLLSALASWKYIETPFRQGRVIFSKTALGVFSATAVVSLALIAIGGSFHLTKGLPQRFDSQTANFAEAANDLFGDLSGCQEMGNATFPDLEYCMIGDPLNSDSYTLIWGDSHGGAYKRGFEYANKNTKHPALLAWTGGCPPVFGIDKDESVSSRAIDAQCSKRNQAVYDLLQSDKRINAVVLVGRWSYYLSGEGTGVDEHNKISLWPENGNKTEVKDQSAFFIERFINTIEKLNQSQHTVFVVEQPPEFSQYKARIVALDLIKGKTKENIAILTNEKYQQVKARQGDIQQAIEGAIKKDMLTLLNTHSFFCDEKQCSVLIDDSPAYFDNNHLSSSGAVKVSAMFQPLISFLNQK